MNNEIDYATLGAALGLKYTCRLHKRHPVDKWVERPADRAKGPLVVALSAVGGRWADSPDRPVLTVTHRASGYSLSSVAGPYHADRTGLRRARAAVKVLLAAPGFDWTAERPNDATSAENIAVLRALLGELGEPGSPAKPRKSAKVRQ